MTKKKQTEETQGEKTVQTEIIEKTNMKKGMYKQNIPEQTGFNLPALEEGESIETKLERMIANKEPISGEGNVELLFTERKDGVLPSYNIKTDRWLHAIDATDALSRQKAAQRETKIVELKKPEGGEISAAEPTQGGTSTTE